ncbi:MAG: NAD(P)/FAD-dependent oxidoreductase [Candidatus Eisenbacteria bacterium]
MKRKDVVIVGGGQAGLAMSHCLNRRGIDHVVLERGEVGQRWRNERWDSLRMLTPRWQSRLPGFSYRGPDADGFMTKAEVISYLEDYRSSFSAPVRTGVAVEAIEPQEDGFEVRTSDGAWDAGNVVLATGACARPNVPTMAASLDPRIEQVVPTRYRNPGQLGPGGVLVVGASATGLQLAAEIARSGRAVTIAVGQHTRLPRNYRGRDILYWLDALGVTRETTDEVNDLGRSRNQPSLQLVGTEDHRSLDLGVLARMGVRVVGRLSGLLGRHACFADDLAQSVRHADRKMTRQLDRVDRFLAARGLEGAFPLDARPDSIELDEAPTQLDLRAEGIETVLWATGYRREYPWLQMPVLDARGELEHDGGITPVAGLYALGLPFQRRRNSTFLDGVGQDAEELAAHMAQRLGCQTLAVAG